jgi:hypothetical protein
MSVFFWQQSIRVASIAVITLLVVRLVYRFLRGSFCQIPGPKLARLSRLWLLYETYAGTLPQTLIELHRVHGQ